jgi:hypothetical protein
MKKLTAAYQIQGTTAIIHSPLGIHALKQTVPAG